MKPSTSEGCALLRLQRGEGDSKVPLKILVMVEGEEDLCSVSQMSKLIAGDETPSLKLACRLRKRFAIPCESWYEPPAVFLEGKNESVQADDECPISEEPRRTGTE